MTRIRSDFHPSGHWIKSILSQIEYVRKYIASGLVKRFMARL
ncbi:unnamed protein product [Acanthoscelides obtectus]|uniref:Uncharacterized protein n=1 Tax=Acanthoscelides obtectus TaxID=200917 RepID=A0A9P0LW04_ACAOB|nr:unnamed protein product [Acanthoscelides obtectus]CAK1686128.1 hypothetical protein AOBTE_LOCUS35803 [Acanthoscelides obtectus]